jgi:molybdopterin-guanine dinucleotide biosynthesis protein A
MMGNVRRKLRCGGKPMTAIVLAGGRGLRMKADKAGLAVGGWTLLEHVLAQVEPYFDEILISVTPGQRLPTRPAAATSRVAGRASPPRAPAPRVRVVRDETPDLGPIGGILAGLRAARNDASMVVACDIADIDLPLMRALARTTCGSEITVPVGPAGLYEPLFAIYRRSVIPQIETLLAGGERSLLPLFDRCRTVVVQFEDAGRIRNLNTRADYESYLRSLAGRASDEGRGRGKRQRGSRAKVGI